MYLDIAQVETAHWSLSPWLLDYEVDGVIRLRDGNRHAHAAPHGAFRCADEGDIGDRWVAIACWSDEEWAALARLLGLDDAPDLASLAGRKEREDEIEALLSAWTATRTRADVAEQLQAAGIEAVPVEDWGDMHDDPQLALRNHFERHTHASSAPGSTSATASACRTAPAATTRPGRRWARTASGCCASFSVAPTPRSPRCGNRERSNSTLLANRPEPA